MATKTKTGKFDEVRKAADRLNSQALSADQLMEDLTLLLNKELLNPEPIRPCWPWEAIRER
jgi:hypothetical protein